MGLATKKAAAQHHAALPPLHKSLCFRILVGLLGLFFILSILLYTKLDEIEGDNNDDVDFRIPGSGGGDGLQSDHVGLLERGKNHFQQWREKRRRRQQQTSKQQRPKENDVEDHNDDDDDQVDDKQKAITAFHNHQEKVRELRQKDGQLSPREAFEEQHPPDDWGRIQEAVQKLRQPDPATQPDVPYNIRDCPLDPPPNYPYSWNVIQVLENWGPDDTELPLQPLPEDKQSEQQPIKSSIYQSLCIFDWNKEEDQDKAENYRQLELPFVVQHFPETTKAAERWMTPGYMESLLGDEKVFNEHSRNNHFMYWRTLRPRNDYTPPTDTAHLTYPDWLEKAKHIQEARRQASEEHWYFRLNAAYNVHQYLYEELTMFDPSHGKSFTMVKPKQHRGINCRFGMKGVIAEAHYDSHNNFISLMGGQRRYILAHPDQCENMELYPLRHPSARHSRVNWSTAHINWRDGDRPFSKARVHEVVLQAGDIMYLPTYWFHFIVSLNINYQCNSRSGDSQENQHFISKCGFGPRKEYDRKQIRGATG